MLPKRLRYAIETLLVNALILSSLYQLLVYLANRRFWRQVLPLPAEDPPAISAVVPLRGKSLDTLALLHVIAATGPTNKYEVLLVVEDTDDPAYPVAQEVAAAYPETVRVVLSGPAGEHVGKLHNLNAGYQAARGELIALIDADAHIKAELWHAALAVLDDPAVGAAFAPPLVAEPERAPDLLVPTGGETLAALHTNHAESAGLPLAALQDRLNALAGGFIVVRRRALDEAGGMLYLLQDASERYALGRALREAGYRLAAIPVPVTLVPEPASFNEATAAILRSLTIQRAYDLPAFLAQPFTNPLTVGFILGLITEREGRWWGRRTWWGFLALRMAIAHDLDRVRFGRAFHWTAYAQLFMLDTFITPALWARALLGRVFTWRGRTYRIAQGGQSRPEA
jgi:cellulose synthase/poly-beta-1,6-N-acetylglucosamine synthase-like glycosyltransferase